jgi:hypothetical protein
MHKSSDIVGEPRRIQTSDAHIDGARYVEFEEAGHALPIQLAHEVNALLLEHLLAAETHPPPSLLTLARPPTTP